MDALDRNYSIRLQKSRLKSIEMSKTEISTEIWSAYGKILDKNQSQGITTMGPPTDNHQCWSLERQRKEYMRCLAGARPEE